MIKAKKTGLETVIQTLERPFVSCVLVMCLVERPTNELRHGFPIVPAVGLLPTLQCLHTRLNSGVLLFRNTGKGGKECI